MLSGRLARGGRWLAASLLAQPADGREVCLGLPRDEVASSSPGALHLSLFTSGTFFVFFPGPCLLQAVHLFSGALCCHLVNCLLSKVWSCLSLCFYSLKPIEVEPESRAHVRFYKTVSFSRV